jgi:hypothetical protein
VVLLKCTLGHSARVDGRVVESNLWGTWYVAQLVAKQGKRYGVPAVLWNRR